jgi:single-strand DNA-binding protein
MSSDINAVFVVGRLTRDPELKNVGQTVVCNMSIANNYSVKVNEQWEERPNYFEVQVWGKRGEVCAQHLTKGRQVAVRGRLRWRSWEGQDGSKRSAVNIEADEVQFIGPRTDAPQANEPARATNTLKDAYKMAAETFAEDGTDDDIPF